MVVEVKKEITLGWEAEQQQEEATRQAWGDAGVWFSI